MNLCPRCGKSHNPDARFCGICGYNLTVTNNSNFVTMHAMKAKDVKFDLAMVYYKESRYKEALEIFERILQDNPEDLQAIDMCNRTRDALSDN